VCDHVGEEKVSLVGSCLFERERAVDHQSATVCCSNEKEQ
jgi:hypothetical protein